MSFVRVVYRGNGSERAIFTALSSDTKGTDTSGKLRVYANDWCFETDGNGDKYEYDGAAWNKVTSGGNANIDIKASDLNVYGTVRWNPFLGALPVSAYQEIPSAIAAGTEYPIDLSDYGSSNIWFVGLTDGANAWSADIRYSNQGDPDTAHPDTATELLASGTLNREVLIPKKDAWAHITVTQLAGGSKDSYCFYVADRDLS